LFAMRSTGPAAQTASPTSWLIPDGIYARRTIKKPSICRSELVREAIYRSCHVNSLANTSAPTGWHLHHDPILRSPQTCRSELVREAICRSCHVNSLANTSAPTGWRLHHDAILRSPQTCRSELVREAIYRSCHVNSLANKFSPTSWLLQGCVEITTHN